ncbi:hypothetical protein [Streptomyces niveus]|uniref:hypothetical protein n=1 Tax=Streptomyces niveus TaxID=193462 RepID=UPI001331A0A1|nr:hypothetical protein [Streptomyces niveus]
MTPPIRELLSRARLVFELYTQDDIDAAEARLEARMANRWPAAPAPAVPSEPERVDPAAERGLQTLCETVVCSALGSLSDQDDFLTSTMPDPPAARVLGCVLQLSGSSDARESARFWWQYAAGGGDPAASYCLYLHHLALGEDGEARWWLIEYTLIRDTETTAFRADEAASAGTALPDTLRSALKDIAEANLPITLRILNALKTHWQDLGLGHRTPVSEAVGAVLDYVPDAVRYRDDDVDLALPDPDFIDHIRTLTTPQPAPPPVVREQGAALPARPTVAGSGIPAGCWPLQRH